MSSESVHVLESIACLGSKVGWGVASLRVSDGSCLLPPFRWCCVGRSGDKRRYLSLRLFLKVNSDRRSKNHLSRKRSSPLNVLYVASSMLARLREPSGRKCVSFMPEACHYRIT